MAIEITMPRLSDTMEQGTVVKWNVKQGQAVASGDVIADIETDKATMELQSFDAGTVAKIAVSEGQQVAVGTVIMVIAEEGEDVARAAESASKSAIKSGGQTAQAGGSDSSSSSNASSSSTTAVAEQAPTAAGGPDHGHNGTDPSGHASRIFASPLAKKIAAEHNLDLSSIEGSGPSGRIVRKDVEGVIRSGGPAQPARQHASQPSPQPSPQTTSRPSPAPLPAAGATLESRTVALSNMRAVIARRLVESKTTIPHYQVTASVRVDALLTLREQLNTQLESQGVKLSVNDFLVRACALAMHKHPFVNASWVDNGKGAQPAIQLHGRVNIGVAIALPEEKGGGLVVATIRDSDQHGLRHISAETKRLARKARDKGLSPEEMSESTFTISNLGMFGVDHFTAIINPPNAAILAVGQSVKKPFIEEDSDGEPVIVVGHEMSMTMSSDHRIIDGAMAAAYLSTVRELLENPATLLV